jgi:hypothetical protein
MTVFPRSSRAICSLELLTLYLNLAASRHLPRRAKIDCARLLSVIVFKPSSCESRGFRMWATNAQATALAIVVSKSFASVRQRASHAKVRSTTRLRGRIAKPGAVSERLMISIVHSPMRFKALRNLSPDSHHRQRYGAARDSANGSKQGRTERHRDLECWLHARRARPGCLECQ